ncbi:MAG: hypothetical protein K0R02_886 [Rickettsiaceae bacterium]|jgi:osmotically-inducible protein OsmY|nr:hypothetical protein [Rickettsiaceae bacterium]
MKIFASLIALIFTLSGCYPVVFAAATTTGVALSKDRSFGEAIDDTTIWTKIKKELVSKGFKELYAKVDVKVDEGRVLLTGFVEHEEDALKAVEICWEQKGVKEVVNELQVDPENAKINPIRYAKDTWFTSQIKGKVFIDKSIKYVNYTIITFDSVVYLFGIARSQEELEKVANIAAQVKGVDRVVSHVKIIDPNERY